MSGRGDGPYTHGNSFANGPGVPGWLRLSWELREVLAAARWVAP